MNGANLLVAALENEGVKQIFGVPGEENLDVVEALRRSTVKLVVTRHEQAAALMAATHGRLTGEAGVCLRRSVRARSISRRVRLMPSSARCRWS
jgi:acetolactate synthase-1/2/3 large subunit